MDWRIEEGDAVNGDLEHLAGHLRASYLAFGESEPRASRRALDRVREVRDAGNALIRTPHIGTQHDDRLPGLRHVTIGRAIYWFVLDEPGRTVRLVGVFYGGQDHFGRIMGRLTEERPT